MNRADLYQEIIKHFNIEELRTLCFKLGIDPDDLDTNTRGGLARELIEYCERKNRVPELVAQIQSSSSYSSSDNTAHLDASNPYIITDTDNRSGCYARFGTARIAIMLALGVIFLLSVTIGLLLYFRPDNVSESAAIATIDSNNALVFEGDIDNSQVIQSNDGSTVIVEERRDNTVDDARITENSSQIEAINAGREPIWAYKVDGEIFKFSVNDLDNDGLKEIILGIRSKEGLGNSDAGKVIILGQDRDQITEYNLYDPNNPNIYVHDVAKRFEIIDLQVSELFGDETLYIVATARNGEWFPSKLVILEFAGGKLVLNAEYWHPGFPRKLIISDLNRDGIEELILSAANNSYPVGGDNPTGVFILESDNVVGQAPPYFGNAPDGTELWYYLVQPANTGISGLGIEDVDEDGNQDVRVELSDACIFYVNYSGDIIRHGQGSVCTLESSLVKLPQP